LLSDLSGVLTWKHLCVSKPREWGFTQCSALLIAQSDVITANNGVTQHSFPLPLTILQGKVKVKLSLCLTKHHAIRTYWGVEVQIHAFLTSAQNGGEWSTSRPGRITPRQRAPGTHWIGVCAFWNWNPKDYISWRWFTAESSCVWQENSVVSRLQCFVMKWWFIVNGNKLF